jgi:integrase
VEAMTRLLASTKDIPAASPVFWREGKSGLTPITYKWFSDRFKELLQLAGEDPTKYGTHSLRRGGATWAFRCGLSAEAIQLLGHWKSDAYKVYLELAQDLRLEYMHQMMTPLPNNT